MLNFTFVWWGVSIGSYQILLLILKAGNSGAHGAAGFAVLDGAKRLAGISAAYLSELPCRIHVVLFYFEE